MVPPTVTELIAEVAEEVGVPYETLYNLADSESKLGKMRDGDDGKSCGLIHFHKDYYPLENSRCEDDRYILTRAAEIIKEDMAHRFTPCSCVQQTRVFVPKLPRGDAVDIKPNLPSIKGANVVIYDYGAYSHVAHVEEYNEAGRYWIERGSNLSPCKVYTRKVYLDSLSVKRYVQGFAKY